MGRPNFVVGNWMDKCMLHMHKHKLKNKNYIGIKANAQSIK